MAAALPSNFELKGLTFCSSFGLFEQFESDDPVVELYNRWAHLANLKLKYGHSDGNAEWNGFRRMQRVFHHFKAGCTLPWKCWLVSQCIRGVLEYNNLGKCCICADMCVTDLRNCTNNPSGGILVHSATQAPVKKGDLPMIRA